MSCDWNIICLDCSKDGHSEIHRFNDANHQDAWMWTLIRHHEAIAALDDLNLEPKIEINFTLGFSGSYGRIDTAWFKRHLGHQLWPIDEYGRLDTQCQERVECNEGHHHDCQLEQNHEGPHSSKGWFKRRSW